jgi:antitoxin CptB
MTEVNRLRWKCRRGMKELDVVLLHYLERHYPDTDGGKQRAFEKLLDMQDPELYLLILQRTVADDSDIRDVVEILRHASGH